MPWHREPMKDVTNCDKPRGAVSTSKQGEEKKSTEIPLVVASERGRGQTEGSNTFGVRTEYGIAKIQPNDMGRSIKEGENPVGEKSMQPSVSRVPPDT